MPSPCTHFVQLAYQREVLIEYLFRDNKDVVTIDCDALTENLALDKDFATWAYVAYWLWRRKPVKLVGLQV